MSIPTAPGESEVFRNIKARDEQRKQEKEQRAAAAGEKTFDIDQFLTQFNKQLDELDALSAAGSAAECLELYKNAKEYLNAHSQVLPAHNVALCTKKLDASQKKIPKAKSGAFKFVSKKPAAAAPTPQAAAPAAQCEEIQTPYSGKTGQLLMIGGDNEAAVVIKDLTSCTIVSRAALTASAHISNCHDCVFALRAHQLRIHDCTNCVLLIECKTIPIFERCSGLEFGPFPSSSIPEDWTIEVRDFHHIKKDVASPNWQLLKRDRWIQDLDELEGQCPGRRA